MRLLRGDDRDALCKRPVVDVALHRRANADLDHAARIDDAFVDRMIEHRAMRIGLAEIIGPCIDVGVEMDQRQRAASFRAGAQERQRDSMVAAKRYEMRIG